MPLMIRSNRVTQVPDNEVNSYTANGYKPYKPATSVQEQATPITDTEEFQAAVTAEVEKRMEGIPSQADFEAAVDAEVERRLTEMDQGGAHDPNATDNGANPDYNDMPDEELATLAAEKNIDISDKTRRQVINALKKAVGE